MVLKLTKICSFDIIKNTKNRLRLSCKMVRKAPFFSIIMPVYGVERYLKQSVDSVLNQTFKDFELILVDDCSPDKSPAICDEYALKDDRIKVIHKPVNEGLGKARNTGFSAVTGEYVTYMDSDDTIQENMLETLFEVCKQSDITVFGINMIHEDAGGNETSRQILTPKEYFGDTKTSVGQCFVNLSKARVFQYVCSKLYRYEFLKRANVEFESTQLIEDFLFNIEIFKKANTVRCISQPFYNYRKPAHQTLVSSYSPNFFGLIKRKYLLEKDFLKQMDIENDESLSLVYLNHIKHLISTYIRNQSPTAKLSILQRIDFIKNTLRDDTVKRALKECKPKGLKNKIICWVLKTGNPWLCLYFAKCISIIQKNVR